MTPAIAEFKQEELSWSITNFGGKIQIDPYDQMPSGTIAVIDIETDEKDNIVCIGICEDGETVKVFFDIRPELIKYLQQVQIIAHNGKGAEIPWLTKYGVTINQLYFDTQIAAYVFDSSRKVYGLKKLLEDLFGTKYPTYSEMVTDPIAIQNACDVASSLLLQDKKGNPKYPKKLTLDKLAKDFVADYNAADCLWIFKLYTWLRQNMSVAQTNFYNNIELPMTRLIYYMEKQGVKIDTKAALRIHKEQRRITYRAEKEFKRLVGLL